MVAARHGAALAADDRSEILRGMRALPPHPDVRPALDLLQDAGFRLATLTNSNAEAAEAQLGHAGLRGYFEQVLSVERVRRLKPAPEVYRMAAATLGVPPDQMRLVAAHAWDVAGALRGGCAAAFGRRQGRVAGQLGARPG